MATEKFTVFQLQKYKSGMVKAMSLQTNAEVFDIDIEVVLFLNNLINEGKKKSGKKPSDFFW